MAFLHFIFIMASIDFKLGTYTTLNPYVYWRPQTVQDSG